MLVCAFNPLIPKDLKSWGFTGFEDFDFGLHFVLRSAFMGLPFNHGTFQDYSQRIAPGFVMASSFLGMSLAALYLKLRFHSVMWRTSDDVNESHPLALLGRLERVYSSGAFPGCERWLVKSRKIIVIN